MLGSGDSEHTAASPWLSTVTPGLRQPLEVDTAFPHPQSPRFPLYPGVDTPAFTSGPPSSPLPLSGKGQCCTPQRSSLLSTGGHWAPSSPEGLLPPLPTMAVLDVTPGGECEKTEAGSHRGKWGRAKALTSCVQAPHCVWADSQQNKGLPLRLWRTCQGPHMC